MPKLKYKLALTTDDRLWEELANQAKAMYDLATNDNISGAQKKPYAASPHKKMRDILIKLGILL